jgi:hypothetical protein
LLTTFVPEHQNKPEASIIPLITELLNLGRYFVGRTHIPKNQEYINSSELQEKFGLLENLLFSLCGYYYSGYEVIRGIVYRS